MADKDIVIIADYTQSEPLTLAQLCEIGGLTEDVIFVLIDHDILQPTGGQPKDWLFDMMQLQRLKKAIRLQRDLELNLAGVALVLELMSEMEDLRTRINSYERHFLK